MSRTLDFFDGLSSGTTPSVVFPSAAAIQSFANDTAYEAVYGVGAAGDIYYNSTTGYIRFYDAVLSMWRNTSFIEAKEEITLVALDITNGYVALAQAIVANSLSVQPSDGPIQRESEDYTLSTVGGVTRLTFAGDLLANLIATDVLFIKYRYLA